MTSPHPLSRHQAKADPDNSKSRVVKIIASMQPVHMSGDKSMRGLVELVSAALHLVPHKRLSLRAALGHRALTHHDIDREVRLAGLRQVVDYMRTHGLGDKLIGHNYDQLFPGPSPSEAVGLLPAYTLASTHRPRDEGSSQGSSGHTTASPALSDGSPPFKRPR